MRLLARPLPPLCAFALLTAIPSDAQSPPERAGSARPAAAATVSADSLRASLFAIADDSMGGRDTGSPGNAKVADWVAAKFARYGLRPAGENGGFFQELPVQRRASDASPGYPVRNVIAVLPGIDSALSGTYVSLSAHNDHKGFARSAWDHDSLRAFNRVVRPMGADSRMRDASQDERARIAVLLDSLRHERPARRDSIFNGADDDGSGTVALVELARVLAAGPRPRRSILFVSHAAEELGLLGSRWFTDHPTIARDSIVAEIDVDMIGRGGAADLPGGGPGYLEVVGSKRLSTEFGVLLDTVAGRAVVPFHFNYEYDAPGHPLRYYCRADHFSYARYGIPSVSLSTGVHLDYHQVTDEAQYIDYDQLARVTALAQGVALAVGNLDHRPVVDGPRQDPHAPCRQ